MSFGQRAARDVINGTTTQACNVDGPAIYNALAADFAAGEQKADALLNRDNETRRLITALEAEVREARDDIEALTTGLQQTIAGIPDSLLEVVCKSVEGKRND